MPITHTNIKLICSDIDGTLLQYGKKTLEAEILSQIKALSARGSARRRGGSTPACANCLSR